LKITTAKITTAESREGLGLYVIFRTLYGGLGFESPQRQAHRACSAPHTGTRRAWRPRRCFRQGSCDDATKQASLALQGNCRASHSIPSPETCACGSNRGAARRSSRFLSWDLSRGLHHESAQNAFKRMEGMPRSDKKTSLLVWTATSPRGSVYEADSAALRWDG